MRHNPASQAVRSGFEGSAVQGQGATHRTRERPTFAEETRASRYGERPRMWKQEIQLRRAPGLAWQLALRTLALCRLSPEL